LVVELFGAAGFTVVYPYSAEKLEYKDIYTKFPILPYKNIEKQ
jgi:hypothetical protein